VFEELKENKTKKWMKVNENLSLTLDSVEYLTSEDLIKASKKQITEETGKTMQGKRHQKFYADFIQQHNTINRLTMTTGEGMFAPFTKTAVFYYPETELAVFVLLDEEATDIERVCAAMENIGNFGFGRDASTGCGRFGLAESTELTLPSDDSCNACYVLSPVSENMEMFLQHLKTPSKTRC
jgi:CRISPR-associated protein Csm4